MQKERKILRLLLFKECNRSCPMCCNKYWPLDDLLIEDDFRDYESIILTGGEPMLKPLVIYKAIRKIKEQTQVPIYLYTALITPYSVDLLEKLDGITLTLHDQGDVTPFKENKKDLEQNGKSLRLNVFKGIDLGDINLERWEVKPMVWVKNSTFLPENEIFKRFT
jgi:MoaA/NifB/PqqE/SkfB family radical SAM enzyme